MAEDDVTGTEQEAAATETEGTQQQFTLQRVYLKDLSFESPDSPAVFKKESWKPTCLF